LWEHRVLLSRQSGGKKNPRLYQEIADQIGKTNQACRIKICHIKGALDNHKNFTIEDVYAVKPVPGKGSQPPKHPDSARKRSMKRQKDEFAVKPPATKLPAQQKQIAAEEVDALAGELRSASITVDEIVRFRSPKGIRVLPKEMKDEIKARADEMMKAREVAEAREAAENLMIMKYGGVFYNSYVSK
jgi:hypothetical protein